MDISPLLIEILAKTDALFWPFREVRQFPQAHAAVFEQRSIFRDGGLPYVGGGGVADRKTCERMLAELEADGLLSIRRHKGKRTLVRLSDAGDDLTRCLTAGFLVHESWPWLKKISKLPMNAGHVLETDLLRMKNYNPTCGPKLNGLSLDLLSLMARGLVSSMSDSAGRIGYGLTPAGRVALKQKPPPPFERPEFDSALEEGYFDEYMRIFNDSEQGRSSWLPDQTNLVAISLSCGLWP